LVLYLLILVALAAAPVLLVWALIVLTRRRGSRVPSGDGVVWELGAFAALVWYAWSARTGGLFAVIAAGAALVAAAVCVRDVSRWLSGGRARRPGPTRR
jgi:hypothetical protein